MTNHRFRILAVCAALAAPALTSSAPARAQGAAPAPSSSAPSGAVDAATLKKARELFDQGNTFYDAGKYPQAEAAYQGAWKLKKSFDLAGNFGNLEFDMNKPRNAAEYLSFALREFPAGGKPALRDALLKRLGEVQKLIGVLRIQVNKPGAEVFIDGVSLGRSPLQGEVYLDPGTHNAEARLEGFQPVQVTFSAVKGRSAELAMTLVPPPGANVPVLVTGGVLTGAGVVAGAIFAGLSASKASSANSQRATLEKSGGCASATAGGACATLRSALDGKATFGSAAVWTFVGAGVVGAGTLIYGLTAGGGRSPRTGVVVLPMMTADGGGLVVGGAF